MDAPPHAKGSKWQRALRPLSSNSSVLEQAQAAKASSTAPGRGGKENAGNAPARTPRASLSKSGGTTPRQQTQPAAGVITRSASKQVAQRPDPPASGGSSGTQQQRPVRAFGRTINTAPTKQQQAAAAAAQKGRAAASARPSAGGGAAAPAAAGGGGSSARCTRSILGAPAAATAAPGVSTRRTSASGTGTAAAVAAAERSSRRASGRQLGMDKLQSEYEALQQKLALLKRDTNRDHGKLQASTPLSAVAPRKPDSAAAAAPPSAAAAAAAVGSGPAAAPDSLLSAGSGGDTASLGLCLPGCENALLCSGGAEGGGVLASLQQLLRQHPGSRLGAAAGRALGDPELLTLIEQGLSAQLQRTKDGATAQSRITELAGLVKVLRRCVRELAGKASGFAELCIRAEREMHQELEKARLDCEAALKRLEAEAALTRAGAAQAEASHKAERAALVTSLDAQKFEVSRLQREVEGLEEQRARAREDAKRSEAARQQLEQEIKELRKASGQQLREVQMTQGEAVKALRDERQAAERKEAALRADNEQLEASLAAANMQLSKLQAQLDSLQQLQAGLQASLQGKQSAEASLMAQLTQVSSELSGAESALAAATSERNALQQQLSSSRDQVMLLESDLKLKASRLEAAQQQLAADAEEHEATQGLLQKQLEELQGERDEARAQLAAAAADAEAASQQLAAASAARDAAEASLAVLQQSHVALTAEHAAAQSAASELRQALDGSEARAKELAGELDDVRAALADARAAAAKQASRLAHLEGEFEALQGVMGEGEQRDIVGRLLSRISNLQAAAAAAEATRRSLHNQMVELRGNIRVFCRVRPHPASAVRCLSGGSSLALTLDGKEHSFGFDKVFGPGTSQQQVFDSVTELVQSALDGYHVCLFSYGQTGAGKTFTMTGGPRPEQQGLMPRALDQILASVAQLTEQEWHYELSASCIEVYNNTLRDLLAEGAGSRPDAGRLPDHPGAIKHDAAGGHTTVAGAARLPVADAAAAAALMARASEARACEATAMNAVSSRSHCVFLLYISGAHAASGSQLTGSLCLVDLAGSERLDRSMVEDQRKREACSINQSLSALGDVFSALAAKSSHVPYRNSKLTYLLQPCLGGHGKTLMFVHINPEPASAQESLCSLKFAAKVNGCETAAKGGARRNVTTLPPGGSGAGTEAAAGGASEAAHGLGKRPAAGQSLGAGPKRSKLG